MNECAYGARVAPSYEDEDALPMSATRVPSHPDRETSQLADALRAHGPVNGHPSGLVPRLREVHGAMIDAVLRGEGLARVAELAAGATAGPVAIIVPRLTVSIAHDGSRASVDPSPLGPWVLERVRGRPAAVPTEVLDEVPVRFRDEIVGMVALLRTRHAPAAEASEFLHLAAAAAVMALAIEDAKEETEQNLRGALLEELRSGQDLRGSEIVRRAARLGCDLSGGAVILCAELTSGRPHLVASTIAAEHPGALAQQLDGTGPEAPARVYAALPASVGAGTAAATVASARRLADRLGRHAVVGFSSFHSDPTELSTALQEAELVLDVLNNSGAPVGDEIEGGTYKLLFRMLASHPEEILSFYQVTIEAVVRYDAQYRTELIRTLEAYLEANCNMNATATAIFAHRHTVAYRLDRIRDLTGLDPMLSDHRERLGLGLKVHRIVAPRMPLDAPGPSRRAVESRTAGSA
jgi:sugar diacid utilization regulator